MTDDPDYRQLAERMADAILAFAGISDLKAPKYARFKGQPEFAEMLIAARRFANEDHAKRSQVANNEGIR